MSFPRRWEASLDPKDFGGVAEYMIDGRRYKLFMTSFRNFTLIGELLDYVFEMGVEHGKRVTQSKIQEALRANQMAYPQSPAVDGEVN